MTVTYELLERGRTFSTRPLGAQLRSEVLDMVSTAGGPVILDFEGVLSVSYSFADEFAGKLAEAPSPVAPVEMEIANARPEVATILEKAMARRAIALAT